MRLSILLLLNFIFLQGLCQQDFKSLPGLAWTFKTTQPIYSSPVANEQLVYVGSNDSSLYCLHLQSGTVKWKFKTTGEIRSAVAIHADWLYVLSGDGLVYCLNKTDGKLKWTFKTLGENKYELFSFADYFLSSPVYEAGVIYFGSGDHHIYAINAENGKLIWKFKTGSIVHTTPVILNRKLYVGSFDGNFYCLHTKNGQQVWKFKTMGQTFFPKGEVNGSPSGFDNMMYVGSRDYNFYALDTAKGFCHWNKRFEKGWAITTPAFKDSMLYLGTSDDQLFLAMDPKNGRVQWQTNLQYNIFGAPAFSETMIYIGTLMGKFFALDRATGKIVWTYHTDAYKTNRLKYFKPDDSYRDDIFGGVLKRNEDFLDLYVNMGAIFSKPCMLESYLIFTSLDGTVYCLKTKSNP